MGTRDLQQIVLTGVAAVGVSSDWNSDHVAASSNIVAPVTSIQVDGCSIKLVILVMHLKLCMEKWFSELLVCILFCRSSAWCIFNCFENKIRSSIIWRRIWKVQKNSGIYLKINVADSWAISGYIVQVFLCPYSQMCPFHFLSITSYKWVAPFWLALTRLAIQDQKVFFIIQKRKGQFRSQLIQTI